MIRAILHGCNGRMGKAITELAAKEEEFTLVAGVDFSTEGEHPYPVFQSLEDCNVVADVVIDFSNAKAVDDLLRACKKKKLPLVLCTTGLSEEQLRDVKETAKQIAILRSANMSLGVNVLTELLKKAVKALYPAGFDVEIVEKHHNQKLDAPSGTAIALADAMNETMQHAFDYKFDRSSERQKRERTEIGIQSVRGGTIVGEHEVIFAGTDEVIELKHTAYSRNIFAKGAIEAAKFLSGKDKGYYSMQDVIA